MNRAHVLLALVLLLCGCGGEDRMNVLLVTFDTTRADRLGCYGYSEPTSPNIDELAAAGALFTDAICTNPITLPSHTSIMTGTYPIFHGVRDNSTFVVRDSVVTLAEVFAREGYQTAAITASFVLDSRFNLDQGFADYNDRVAEGWSKDEIEIRAANAFGFAERKANLVTTAAIDWLRKPRSKPFFLWLHYFDPHQPVNPPEPHHSRFSEPYAGEIAYMDEQFGHVLTELKSRGEFEHTLIVLVADHGEGQMDHSEPTHSLLIFDSTMRVPLIFHMPGAPAGLVLDELASGIDVMPTILDLLELEIPADVQGYSLAPLIRGYDVRRPPRAIYCESMVPALQCGWGELRAIRTTDEKLIHGPQPRYYRIAEDPGEVYDLAASEPQAVERLTAELQRLIARCASTDADSSVSPADPETLRKLAALGYIGGSNGLRNLSSSLDDVAGKDDPSARSWVFDLIGVATENIRTGYELEGIGQLQQVLSADPDNPSALTYLAKAYLMVSGQPKLAREYFERSLAVNPNQEEALYHLGRLLRISGDIEGASRCAQRILEFQPHSLGGLYEMAAVLETMGEPQKAREHLKIIIEIDPGNVGALLGLALSHGRQKEHDEAGYYLTRALAIEPNHPILLYNAGVWHLQGEDIEEAITSLTHAIQADPTHPDAHFVLGRLLYDRQEMVRARPILLKARELARREDRRQSIDSLLQELERVLDGS